MLQWPKTAGRAIATLFRSLQDVDIYVEDRNDEVFYRELITRVLPPKVRLERVVALGDRTSVIDDAVRHDPTRRAALYLIDGDLEWVKGDACVGLKHLHRLSAYCIENLLIDEYAVIQILIEDTARAESELAQEFHFEDWASELRTELVPLFVAFAVLNRVAPDEPTVSNGFGKIIIKAKNSPARICATQIGQLKQTVLAKAVAASDQRTVDELFSKIAEFAAGLSEKLDIVSGKDFLLPLLLFKMHGFDGCRISRKAVRMRLARRCNIERLASVRSAIAEVLK